MNNWSQKIGLFCLVSGFLLAFGAYLSVGADISQFSTGGPYQRTTYTIQASELDSLDIHTDFRNVEIIGANQNEISIIYYENRVNKFEFDINNRELTVRSLYKTEFPYINFEFGWNREDYTTVITIPQHLLSKIKVTMQSANTLLKDLDGQQEVEIIVASGNIHVERSELRALTVEGEKGNVNLAKIVTTEQMHLQTEAGNVSLSEVQTKGMRLDIESGNVYLREVRAHDDAINVHTKSGNINLKEVYSNKSINLQSESGDITGQITGASSDYNIYVQAKKSNLESTLDINDGLRPLQLISKSGIVEVTFTEKR